MFSFPEAAHFLGVRLQFPQPHCYVSGASIDTRSLDPGNLFVALKGERQDGHRFLEGAFRKGASGALIDQSFFENEKTRFENASKLFQNLLPVSDPQEAFSELARWHRLRVNPTCVGITGSVGKTSTKEFLYYLLKTKYPVVASRGNFNNHLGVPLTLMGLQPTDRFCIAELGANHAGEIALLADILQPSRGILTCVSWAHLKGFGSLDAIYEAKLELLAAIKPRSFVVLPAHDPILLKKAKRFPLKKITVGPCDSADRVVTDVEAKKHRVSFKLDGEYKFSFPGVAPFMAQNAAMAIVMAEVLGVTLSEMSHDWNDLILPKGRFESHQSPDGVEIIDDSYNANPYSFEKALEAFSILEKEGKRFLVFSDMLELGEEEIKWHVHLGERIAKCPIDYVAAFGSLSRYAIESIRQHNPAMDAKFFETSAELTQDLKSRLKSGDTLLLKGSRGMQVERVLQELEGQEVSKTS